MNKETLRIPKLTDTVFKKIPEEVPFFNLNMTVLFIFLGFFVFFLLNCKSGIFKNIDVNPIPYSMIK